MNDDLRHYFERLGPLLMEGDSEDLSEMYVFPISVFVHGEIRVERTADSLMEYMTHRRDQAYEQGVRSIIVEPGEIERMSGGRIRVVVDVIMTDRAGAELFRNASRYLLRRMPSGELRAESLEITKLGLPFPDRAEFVPRH